MTTFTLAALDASRPTDYLAALGLTHLLPNARLSFQQATPNLTVDTDRHEVVNRLAEDVEALTAPEASPLPDGKNFETTTPTWSALSAPSTKSWTDPAVDGFLRTFDAGGTKPGEKSGTDPKVRPASLVLITGKSYTRNSLGQLWPPPARKKDAAGTRERQRADLRDDLARLLGGGVPDALRGALAMRLTVGDPSPRLRSGSEESFIYPSVEALAFAGMTLLLPRQLGYPSDGSVRPRPGLTWALNPSPLSATAAVAIHEQQSAPPDWPRFTAITQTIGGGNSSRQFVDVRPLEAP